MIQHQELLVFLGNGRSDGTPSDKVGEVLENVQRGRRHLLGTYRCDDVQPLVNDFHLQVFSAHHRVSVKMEHSLLRTVYDDALVLHRFDTAVLVECPVKQLE